MRTIPLFCFTGSLILLLSCGESQPKQAQENDAILIAEVKTDTIIHDTTNFKTMKSQEEYKIIKRFDIENFRKNQVDDTYEFISRDGIRVEQEHGISESDGEFYIDRRNYTNSPYAYICMYDKMGYIKLSLTRFHVSVIIGKIYNYDTSGNIIKETDEDAPYKFSIDDLILKMKREYNIDIESTETISFVVRSKASVFDFPLYEVGQFIKQDTYCRCFLINGNTGKTLYVSDRVAIESDMDDNVESLVDEYKRVKKIK